MAHPDDPSLTPSKPPTTSVFSGTSGTDASTFLSSQTASGTTSPAALDAQAHDILLARLVIEKGFATEPEVERCKEKARGRSLLGRQKTLGQVMIEQQAITPNQLDRLELLITNQRTGKTIPGFKMLGKLGKGTTATVYKARQLNLDRLVAIKVLPASAMKSAKAVEAFYAEGRAAAQLNHRNIVQAFDVGQWSNFHYFVMEYVEGQTIHELLQERGALEPDFALEVTISMAEALKHAHEKGFVHRDVKPKNIIMDAAGTPKLADLGLARAMADRAAALAERGQALGTPYYIAPEQVRGEIEIGPPADIYSLGATFYHMVTGLPPFTGNDAKEVMDLHLHEPARPPIELAPKLPPGLSEVIEKMLHKKPTDRYADCGMLLLDLEAWKAVFTLQRGEAESERGG